MGLRIHRLHHFYVQGQSGTRSLRLTGLKNGQNIGLTGFGASGHLVLKLVRLQYPDAKVFVFARNSVEREFAKELGAVWAGDTAEASPELLDSVIDTHTGLETGC